MVIAYSQKLRTIANANAQYPSPYSVASGNVMSDMPWVRFFPSDWLGGTRSLSAAETGIYITLVATMYERSAPISYDHAKLARLCGASNSTFKAALASLIEDGKIIETPEGLWNERVQKEVVYRQEKSEVGSRAAKVKWDRKRNEINETTDAPAMPSLSDRNANQKPELEPEARKKEDSKKEVILSPKAPKPQNGSRLSAEWALPKAWGEWALENVAGSTVETIRSQAEQFRDYWVGKAGAGARKADWEATWRNWMRNAKISPRASPAQTGQPRNIFEASTQLLNELKAAENGTRSDQIDNRPEPPIRYLAASER